MDDVISSGLARLNSVSFEMTDRTLKDALRISTNNSERMMLMRKLQDVGVSFIIHADAKAGYNLRNDVITTFVTETDEFTDNYLSFVEGLEYAEIIFDSTTDTPSLTPSYDPTISLEPTNSPRHGSSNTQSYSEKNVPVATAAAGEFVLLSIYLQTRICYTNLFEPFYSDFLRLTFHCWFCLICSFKYCGRCCSRRLECSELWSSRNWVYWSDGRLRYEERRNDGQQPTRGCNHKF